MPLLYKYFFTLSKTVNGQKTVQEKVIYAPSEKEAREMFEEFFGVEAGKLLKRENW